MHVPEWTRAEISDAAFSELPPTEYRADLVIVLRRERPVLGVVCEAQLRIDPVKGYRWPCYGVLLRDRWHCPVVVLVITPDAAVAEWASRSIRLGGPASVFTPVVLGPAQIPRFTPDDLVQPEMAVLSALAHGNDAGGLDTVMAALRASMRLDAGQAAFYYDLIASTLNDATRIALEELMQTQGYEYKSEFGREAFSRGKVEGQLSALRGAILQVLDARGVAVSNAERARIEDEADPAVLDRWHWRATRVATTTDIFEAGQT